MTNASNSPTKQKPSTALEAASRAEAASSAAQQDAQTAQAASEKAEASAENARANAKVAFNNANRLTGWKAKLGIPAVALAVGAIGGVLGNKIFPLDRGPLKITDETGQPILLAMSDQAAVENHLVSELDKLEKNARDLEKYDSVKFSEWFYSDYFHWLNEMKRAAREKTYSKLRDAAEELGKRLPESDTRPELNDVIAEKLGKPIETLIPILEYLEKAQSEKRLYRMANQAAGQSR